MSLLTDAEATAAYLTKAQATLDQIGNHPILKSYLTSAQASNNAVIKALTPTPPAPMLTLSNLTATLAGTMIDVSVDCSPDIVNVTIYDSVTGQKAAPDVTPVKGVAYWTLTELAAGVHQLEVQGWDVPAGEQGKSSPVVVASVTVPAPPTPAGPGIPGDWDPTPKFFEDFDTGALPAAWWVEQGYNKNGVTVESSNLSFDDSCAVLQLSDAQHGVELLTHDLIIGVGDYFEFKAKCLAWGNWMACWACGVTWPQDGESDTLESGNGGHPTYNYHWGLNGSNSQYDSRTYPVTDNEFHRWGTLRGATSLQMYLDGEPFGAPIPTDDTGAAWYAILTMGLYGGATGVFGPAGAMWVDSVTVWSPASSTTADPDLSNV